MDLQTKIVLFGFGAQGRAQALNLKDGGFNLSVYLRPESPRTSEVKEAGIPLITDPQKAAQNAEVAVFLLPDSIQPDFWEKHLKDNLQPGASLIFAHGFNIHFKQIIPRDDINILLAAPFMQADRVRQNFVEKKPIAIATAIDQDVMDNAYTLVEEFARAIGGEKANIIASTFKEETETDLFGEQVLLVGGLLELVQSAVETLIEAGYSEEIAKQSCYRELLPMVELLDKKGIKGFRKGISDTALFGGLLRGKQLINEKTKTKLRETIEEIRSGKFTEELLADKKANWSKLKQMIADEDKRPLAN